MENRYHHLNFMVILLLLRLEGYTLVIVLPSFYVCVV